MDVICRLEYKPDLIPTKLGELFCCISKHLVSTYKDYLSVEIKKPIMILEFIHTRVAFVMCTLYLDSWAKPQLNLKN